MSRRSSNRNEEVLIRDLTYPFSHNDCDAVSSDKKDKVASRRGPLPGIFLRTRRSVSRPEPAIRRPWSAPHMSLFHRFRHPGLSEAKRRALLAAARERVSLGVRAVDTEFCYNIEVAGDLPGHAERVLTWLLAETFEPDGLSDRSFLGTDGHVLEVGPRMSFTTAWSTNAVAVCHACGLATVRRIERSRRFSLTVDGSLSDDQTTAFLALVHDRMTECRYPRPLESFATGVRPEPAFTVPVLAQGRAALERINREMGLAFDDWDLDYYTALFRDRVGRDPTNVECFDIAQSNSEHSRHWFFKGRLVIDGEEQPGHLLALVKGTLDANPANSVIAFRDNSSAIRGYPVRTILPAGSERPGALRPADVEYHVIFTAETHNFPSGVAPFPGAETGSGGRIRDVQATGRGGLVVAGTAAYCVGNLRIPGYRIPWEDPSFAYPGNLASPLSIGIDASNGASDYGNKFGEPVIQGFTRSFGLRLPGGERREWIKPIMFTGGIGQMDSRHVEKGAPETGMLVTKIGGPAYRIGLGGGAASSMIQGENVAELDFNAVQRGDAEMEQKMNRVIRACVERGDKNPIVTIHDQGAGGNCNVIKEIVYPSGGHVEIRNIESGDTTLSVLEIWGAEYQENNAILLRPEHRDPFTELCEREKVPLSFIGSITDDGMIVVHDNTDNTTPVNLELEYVLGQMPAKTFHLDYIPIKNRPLTFPEDLTVEQALTRVLRVLSVGSKRFLTNKVDRSVTGLIVQQQCVGPLHLTVSDVAVIAQSHFGLTGAAISIGEQPVKTLLSPSAMARLSVTEALTNLVWARVSSLEDVKC